MRRQIPSDVTVLARDLGISGKLLRKLHRRHGDRLAHMLQKRWRAAQERPRYLHKDMSRGYTTSSYLAAAGEPEAVSEAYQRKLTQEAWKRWEQREEAA